MSFDMTALMNATTEAAGSTEYLLVPEGEEILGTLKVDASDGEKLFHKWEKNGRTGLMLKVAFESTEPMVKKLINRDKLVVNCKIGLDLTESGALDMGPGMNVPLNKLREACGLNRPGQRFSFASLNGQQVRAVMKQRKGDDDKLYQDVKAWVTA